MLLDFPYCANCFQFIVMMNSHLLIDDDIIMLYDWDVITDNITAHLYMLYELAIIIKFISYIIALYLVHLTCRALFILIVILPSF